MTELKNNERELHLFRVRLTLLGTLVFICFALLLARLVWLQVIRHSDYMAQAEDNRIAVVPIQPNRGLILDRNGVVLARNYSAYTLEITPSKLRVPLEEMIDALALIVEVTPKDRRRFKKLMDESKNFASVPLRTRLSDEEVARFTANRFRYPGVEVQARLFRNYPLGETASHVIGYIGRINQKEAKAIEEREDAANYNGTDYIGKEGLEKSYEKHLHGITGYEEVEVSAGGRAIRTLSRTPPTSGSNLILSIDIELQKIAEEAFGEWRGALVAIEPSTGDVLAYVSRPGYDPNLFVDGIDSQSWNELNTSLDRPMVNRPLSGTYAPGSTFKPFMALAALETGKRTPSQAIFDPGFMYLGTHKFRDDVVNGHGTVDLRKSIVVSCNTYYYHLGRDMGIDMIHDFMKPFGFGQKTGIDLDNEKTGVLPSKEWKQSRYKKNPRAGKWVGGDTISVSNGSGYNSYTPLQIAHAVANLANNGIVMKPHLVKIIEDGGTRARTLTVPKESYRIPLKQQNIDLIKDAMVGVVSEQGGTATRAFAGVQYTVGGKTGTAQVVGIRKNEKYNAKTLAERLRDNALFTAFAPADKPRIVIAMVVENAGFGGAVAAPIARKVLDYYMLGKRPTEKNTDKVPKEDAEVFEPIEGPLAEEEAALAREQLAAQQAQAGQGAQPGAPAAAGQGAVKPAPRAPAGAAQNPPPGPGLMPVRPPTTTAPASGAPPAPAGRPAAQAPAQGTAPPRPAEGRAQQPAAIPPRNRE
ncbi:penicillin-binding protein 2 [Pseudoduganella albidiflava]|uniref:Peptidoglycan D,D-transpeptidase MrdA n=1 Tax=Pseudoduganella albidiflava TaxID=321983 RepID=A0A411X3T9_9BURK|nr:penicillin-binding protein 2 [Pseudoduganella albidiflava]QBI03671.1 penicillin-binding protein 2 [Pseudoduganella albidiflava]GGY51872.1 penicillin-binding protein [Pseudoduganella albidiflava]